MTLKINTRQWIGLGLSGLLITFLETALYRIAWYRGFGNASVNGHLADADRDVRTARALHDNNSEEALLLLNQAIASHLLALDGMGDHITGNTKISYDKIFPRLKIYFLSETEPIAAEKSAQGKNSELRKLFLLTRKMLLESSPPPHDSPVVNGMRH